MFTSRVGAQTNGTWNVDANGNWGTASNWASSIIANGVGATANFTNNITTTRTITLDSNRTIGNLVFSDAGASGSAWILSGANTLTLSTTSGAPTINALTSATISLTIAGTQGFTKLGAGTLVLGGNNIFTGTTTVSAGALQIGGGGTTGSIVGNLNLAAGTTVSFNCSDTYTYGGIISGGGSLLQVGTGTTVLSNSNSYSGGTTISSGILQVLNNSGLGTGAATVNAGGTLDLAAGISPDINLTANAGTILAHGDLTIGNTTAHTLAVQNAGQVTSVNGSVGLNAASTGTVNISGTGSQWNGTGVLYFGYTGTGSLNMQSGAAVSASNVYLGYNVGSNGFATITDTGTKLTTTGFLAAGWGGNSVLNIQNGAQVTSGGGYIANNNSVSSVTVSGTGSVWNTADIAIGYGGQATLTITGGGVVNSNQASIGLFPSSTATASISGSSSQWNVGNGLYVGGSVFGSAGVGSVTVTAGGSLNVTGTLKLWDQGSLTIGGGTVTPGVLDASLGTLTVTGGTLNLRAAAHTAGTVVMGGGAVTGTGTLTGSFFDFQSGTVTENLAGTAGLMKSTSGNLFLSGANSYSGGTTIAGGYLLISSDANLGNAAGSITFSGGILQTSTSFTTGRTIVTTTGAFANFDGGGGSPVLTLNGQVTGAGGLETFDSGILILNATNNYSGMTVITGSNVLRAVDGVGLPSASLLNLNMGTLESSGNFTRTVGGGAGQVEWTGPSGGFAAKAGALNVQLNGGTSQINWSSVLGGASLLLGSSTADNVVDFQNSINLFGTRLVNVADNTGAAGDLAALSGALSNGNLEKSGAGTLVISGANSFNTAIVDAGALRAVDGVGLPTASLLEFNGSGLAATSVYETSGTFTRSVGFSAGQVGWNRGGGFAAQGGSLAVRLNNGTGTINSNSGSGLFGSLVFGSATADNLVDFQNGINLNGSTQPINVIDNPFSGGDLAQISGSISNGAIEKLGTGTLVLTATNSYSSTTLIDDGALRAVDGVGLPTAGLLYFNANSTSKAVLESHGIFTRTVGSGSGQVYWGSGTGGFSAQGGTLTVRLNNGAGAVTVGSGGFVTFGGTLNFGSVTADSLVDFQNGINLSGSAGTFRVTDNPFSTGDLAQISGVLSNGSVTLTGDGTLILSAANSYFGGTTILGGTLAVGIDAPVGANGALGNASSAVLLGDTTGTSAAGLVAAGAYTIGRDVNVRSGNTGTITLGGTNTTGTAHFTGNILLNKDATFTAASGGTVSFDTGAISGTGTVTVAGGGTVIFAGNNSYVGDTVIGAAELRAAEAKLGTGNLRIDGGTLTFQSVAAFSTSRSITLGGGGGRINSSSAATLAGLISGSGGLTLQGAVVVSNTANTYSGGTSLAGATVSIGQDSQLGAGGITTLAVTSNTLVLNGGISTTKSIALAGNLELASTGFNSNFGGAISGSGGLTLSGTGQVLLTGTNSYSGGTTISAGTLVVGGNSALGPGLLTIASTGTLDVNGRSPTVSGLSGGGKVLLGAAGSLSINQTSDQLFSGTISGTGGVFKSGGGTLTLAGANDFVGNVLVQGGALQISADVNLGNSANVTTLDGGGLKIATGYSSGLNLVIGGAGGTISVDAGTQTFSQAVTGTGNLTKSGNGALALSSLAGTLAIAQGTVVADGDASLGSGPVAVSGSSTIRLASTLTSAKVFTLGGQLQFDTAGFNATLSGPISGTQALVKQGAGTLTLSGTNSHGSTVLNQGTIVVTGAGALGNGSFTANGGTLQAAATFAAANNLVVQGPFTIDTGGFNVTLQSGTSTTAGSLSKVGGGNLAFSNSLQVAALTVTAGSVQAVSTVVDHILTLQAGTTLTLGNGSSSISSAVGTGNVFLAGSQLSIGADGLNGGFQSGIAGSGAVTKTGAGNTTLSAVNTYTGGTTIAMGTLTAAAAGALPFGQDAYVAGGATLNFNGFNQTIGLLRGTGSVQLASRATLSLGTAGDQTVGVAFSGSGGLSKIGAGTVTLSSGPGYSGSTVVGAGTLVLPGIGNSTAFTAGGGGTLRFLADTLNFGAVALRADTGGTIDYGNATIVGGFLRGTGIHAFAAGASLNGTTIGSDVNLAPTVDLSFENVSQSGALTNAAGRSLTWDGGANNAAARMTVGGTTSVSAFENDGSITIVSGGVLNNGVANLVSGGGSRITVNNGGTVNLVGGTTLELQGALLVNNGDVNGTVNVQFGSTAKGSGTFDTVNVFDGGRFSPGNSPGTATVSDATWGPGGSYVWEINDVDAGMGLDPGWDWINIANQLNITATSGNQFTIEITSLNLANGAGPVHDFNPFSNYSWTIASAGGGIYGFDTSVLNIGTAGFQNSISGSFSLSASGNNLRLNYTAVPEPTSLLLAGMAGAGAWWRRRSRRRKRRGRAGDDQAQ